MRIQDLHRDGNPRSLAGLSLSHLRRQRRASGAVSTEQKKKAERDSDSDFEEVRPAKKGGRRKLDLHARSSSQPVLYPFMSMFIPN